MVYYTIFYKSGVDSRAALNCRDLYHITFFNKFCSHPANYKNYKMLIAKHLSRLPWAGDISNSLIEMVHHWFLSLYVYIHTL
jgi:hypothetical protein